MPFTSDRYVDDNWRECSTCEQYQKRSEYTKRPKSKYGHYTQCKSCARKRYVEYNKKTPSDVRYKTIKAKRNPSIWSRIMLLGKSPDIYVVRWYKNRKWYLLESEWNGISMWMSLQWRSKMEYGFRVHRLD